MRAILARFAEKYRPESAIILGALLIRGVYVSVFSSDPYAVLPDSGQYEAIARQFANGDYSGVLLGRFIVAPLYPFILSILMRCTESHWLSIVIWAQVLVSSAACAAFYRLALIWFNDSKAALLGATLYAANPFMFYYTGSLSTESLFASLLICFLFCLELALSERNSRWLVLSGILYGLDYLLKSPILLLSPFLVGYMVERLKAAGVGLRRSLWSVGVFALVSFSLSLPYGLYHYLRGDGYILSSNGGMILFMWGNSNFGYLYASPQDAETKKDMAHLNWCKFDPEACKYDHLPQREKQGKFVRYALQWIRNNPYKFVHLKLFHFWSLLRPGPNPEFFSWQVILASRLVWTPLYLLSVVGFLSAAHRTYRKVFAYLFLIMAIQFLVLYSGSRFKNVILEPFIVMYAAAGLLWIGRAVSRWRGSLRQP
ncbi:MAG: glycosyltransferase family 39 protein [Elusimicrobia bacterium]|nr:glycosyltransferase family 39 protein [Elusimicrobiota bacterium]